MCSFKKIDENRHVLIFPVALNFYNCLYSANELFSRHKSTHVQKEFHPWPHSFQPTQIIFIWFRLTFDPLRVQYIIECPVHVSQSQIIIHVCIYSYIPLRLRFILNEFNMSHGFDKQIDSEAIFNSSACDKKAYAICEKWEETHGISTCVPGIIFLLLIRMYHLIYIIFVFIEEKNS